MEQLHIGHSIRNRVFAVFPSGTHSFDLPRDATFADLAGRLARLGERHDKVLLGVKVATNPWTE